MLYPMGTAFLYYDLYAVGTMLSNALVNAGLITFQKLADTNPREIELVRSKIINAHLVSCHPSLREFVILVLTFRCHLKTNLSDLVYHPLTTLFLKININTIVLSCH